MKPSPIGKIINDTRNTIFKFLNGQLEGTELGNGQFGMLYQIYLCKGMSQVELKEKFKVEKSTVTRALNKLENNGYITRKKDKKDKRILRLYCTKKACDIIPKIDRIIALESTVLEQNITSEEIAITRKVLNQMMLNVEEFALTQKK